MVNFVSEYKDFLTISLSALSFSVACLALFFSARTAMRDKERLLITARTVRDPMYKKIYKIEITVVNIGRRIAAIEGVYYHYKQGYKCYDYNKECIIIKEKDRITLNVDRYYVCRSGDDGEAYILEDITILDTQGVEYKIKNSKKLVKKLIREE